MGSPVRVKVCGIRRLEDVETALNLGAEFIGVTYTRILPEALPSAKLVSLSNPYRRGNVCWLM